MEKKLKNNEEADQLRLQLESMQKNLSFAIHEKDLQAKDFKAEMERLWEEKEKQIKKLEEELEWIRREKEAEDKLSSKAVNDLEKRMEE